MIRIRKHGSVIASFATPQEIVIDHANDSINLGDGATEYGPAQAEGGAQCLPVAVMNAQPAPDELTDGTQKTQITDGAQDVEVDDVGGEKALKVSVISTVGGGAAPAHVDEQSFTIGTDALTPIGAMYQATPDSVDDGEVGVLRMTIDRLLLVSIAASALPTGAATSANQTTMIGHLDGVETLLTDIEAAVDGLEGKDYATEATLAAVESAVDGIEALLGTIDADTSNISSKIDTLAGAVDGTEMQVDVLTLPNVTIGAAIPAGTNNIGDVDVLSLPSIPAGNNNIGDVDIASIAAGDNNIGNVDIVTMPGVEGAVAADADISGVKPLLQGLKTRTTALPARMSAADDADQAISDGYGRQIIAGNFSPDMIGFQTTNITNTTQTTIVSAAASTYRDIISMTITNNSDVQSIATLRDSSSGTTRMVFLVPARGGVVYCPSTPMPQLAGVNNNWTLQMGTTATSTDVSVMYGNRPG